MLQRVQVHNMKQLLVRQAPTPGGRAPAAPISQHPQSRSDSDSGSLNGRFRGGITGATPTTTSPNRPQSNNDSNHRIKYTHFVSTSV